MQSPFISERIGVLCGGGDYWWDITDEILDYFSLEAYYDNFMQLDIKKVPIIWTDLLSKKEQSY